MEFIKKIGKSENGSVTVYVLSTLIVVLLVTTTIYIGLRNKTTTQIKQMDKINREYSLTDTDMQEAYDKAIMGTLESVKGTETTNTTVKDNLGNKVVVPAGFKVINPNDNVTNGIVVEDVTHEATKGSQFVWIPVGDVIKDSAENKEKVTLGRYVFNEDGTIDTALSKTEPGEQIQPSEYSYYFTEGLNDSTTSNTHAKDIAVFKSKAESNHGYYIGRYEARTNTERKSKTDKLTQITVKPDEYVYNYTTQLQAAELSRGMYSDSNFESDLVNSYAWDTAVYFLQKFDNRTNKASLKPYSQQNSLNTSLASQGTNNLKVSKQDKICSLYDMASNCREWTTETCSDSDEPCTRRGGYYSYSISYTSKRYHDSTSDSGDSISFRSLLYM